MKFLNQLDLENLINNQVEESLYLDYKAADALQKEERKKIELTKDVSAFANSDGGTIIYGIKEFSESSKKHLPEKIDPLERKTINKEWIEQVINSGISPRIYGIIITPIIIDNEHDKVVYVVEIPKSNLGHQALDKKYYKRFNFESQAMFDYEIRDIMNRNKFPEINLKLTIIQETMEITKSSLLDSFKPTPFENKKEYRVNNTLIVKVNNVGKLFASYVNCYLDIPASLLDESSYKYYESYNKDGVLYKKLFCKNIIREIKEVKLVLNNYHNEYWPSRYDPILPGTSFVLDRIQLNENLREQNEVIFFKIYADNSPEITGEVNLADVPKVIKS